MAYIGTAPTIGNFQVCDAISTVNGQASYTMQVSGVNATPQSANHMLVSLNGILQQPNSSFTVSGSTITFASNLVTGDVIDFIQILGDVLDLGVPSDSTVSLAKLTATGTKNSSTFLRGDNTFAEAGGGMHTLISTTTVNNAATTEITGMDSTYSRYLVTIDNLKCQTDGSTVYMRVIIGGSVQTGSHYPYGNNTRNSGTGAGGNESGDATSFKISKSAIGNATGENFSGEITLYNPSETSQFKNISWRSVYTVNDGTIDSNIGGGMYKSGQAAITGISILMSGGNITSAVIKLYGIT